MHVVGFDGTEVAYRVDGQGPPVVLIHGTGGDSETNWRPMADRLAGAWRVVRPDYAGSGATRDDGRALTLDALAGQVAAAAQDAGAVPCHLVGFSLGAAVAVRLAATRPDLVRTVTLVAGFASADDARLGLQFALWRELAATDRRTLARLILLTGFSPDAVSALGADGVAEAVETTLATAPWEGMVRQIEVDLALDVRADAARIAAPALVIGCALDHMVPPSHARRLAETIPGARYAELASGHLAPMERPDDLAELVAAFLREHAGTGPAAAAD